MRFISYGILILLILLSGCGNNNEQKEKEQNKDQPLSVAPNIPEEQQPDEEEMEKLQDQLNEQGEAPASRVSITPANATYKDDGTLVIDGFVRNGYEYTIWNLNGEFQVLDSETNDVIASEKMNLSEKDFGKLKSGESRLWQFNLKPESVKIKDHALQNYTVVLTELTIEHEPLQQDDNTEDAEQNKEEETKGQE